MKSEQYYRTQYLIGATAGCTGLVLSLLVFATEGALVADAWIRERTVNPLLFLVLAVLFLFQASLAHSNMLFARRTQDTPEQWTGPVRAGRLVTLTLLLTLLVAFAIELHTVLLESGWRQVVGH
jgi:hypothetical protein